MRNLRAASKASWRPHRSTHSARSAAMEGHEGFEPSSSPGSSPEAFRLVHVRTRRTSGLSRHAVAEIDDSRAEGAGLDEFEIHPAVAPGKERNATADQHRVDHGPILVDQTQGGRL